MHHDASRAPTVRTLLLTDVVDSTKLSEALGDAAMADLWAKHDRVARDLLVEHRGREIDKTDGFLMLFEQVSDAVRYAVAYHRALRQLDISARAGIHVGEVILTENAPDDVARGAKPLEVDGIAKPTAARVMSVATGGQTLLTPSAVEALGDTELRLESHGHWRMKGVTEPIELFEAGDEDAPFAPPPDAGKVYRVVERDGLWLPVKEVKHSLPAERDAFVGRSDDLQTLNHVLAESRLVSVLGIGGTGKTRLVTRFGWTWLGDYPGGVWFCDLSEARSRDGVVSAVARALDVPLGKDDPVVQLGRAIAGRGPCLVILDNFEQVARFAPETVGPWLDRAADARFVVTTREVLGLPGETALPLSPLRSQESFDLFVARARQAKAGFDPTDTASIEALVTLLDHLPLAIELAAARVRMMPPKTLLKRMSQRFKLLSSRGGRHTRQATLRGALDWSWDLLDADEQAALAQLSVFEGGFTVDAAESVLELDELWGMDAVQALLDKSLVRQVADDRFDLLVSVQEYAAERLQERDGVTAAEVRHGAWVAELRDGLGTEGSVERAQALTAELDNTVVACRRAVARGDGQVAVRALEAAGDVMAMTGPYEAAVDLARPVVALWGRPPKASEPGERADSDRARAERRLGLVLRLAGRMDEARDHLERALSILREVGDRRGEGFVLGDLGMLHRHQGRTDEARDHYVRALAIHREFGDRRAEGAALSRLGNLNLDQGRMDETRDHYVRAMAIHREVGDRHSEGVLLGLLGILRVNQGRMDEAQDHFERALDVAREVGNRNSEGIVLSNLGTLNLDQGRMDEARDHLERALAIHREVGDCRCEGSGLGSLGLLHYGQGRMDEARDHFERALAIHREVGDRIPEGIALANLGNVHHDQGRMDEARDHFERALDVAREVGHRRFEGWTLVQLAHLDASIGDLPAATALLDTAEPLLRHIGDPAPLAAHFAVRAEIHHLSGRPDAARSSLAEAEATAPPGHLDATKAIARARALLDGEE